jgi:xylulokinase
MDLLLGIDLGSTSIKAVLYDTDGNLITSGSTPTEVSHLDPDHPDWAFWDPDVIWESVAGSTRKIINTFENPQDIKALAVTGWGMDGLPVDKDGNPLYPFISWHCSRTESQSRKWSSALGAEKIFSIAGTQVMAIHSVYRMQWMMEHHPEIMAKTDTWLLIEDFINYRLCGVMGTDFSMASCTSLVDQKGRRWSDELIDLAGLPRNIFPEIRQSGTIIGNVTSAAAKSTGLAEGTPVVLGGHDYHCAGLAVGAFEPGIVMDITGTWEILFAATSQANLDKAVFDSGLLLESHVAKDCYNYACYALSAGMLEWFKDQFAAAEAAEAEKLGTVIWEPLMKGAAAAPVGAKGVFFLPHFSGAVTPHVDPKSLGAFIGLSETAEKGVMLRALIEGLDYQFRELVESFETALETKIEKIVAVGGTTKNTFWMQNKADISGKVIEVPGIEEATPLGAAMLAGIGAGIYKNERDAFTRTYRRGNTYTPNPTAVKEYDRYYPIYKRIYPALKELSSEIFESFKQG